MDATMLLDETAVFVRVVEHESFSAAARELGVPTSTVSRQVQRLEDALGVRLLQRTTRKLALTDAGAEFFRRVGPAVDAVAEASDFVRGLAREPSGTLRVTAPIDMSAPILSQLIAEFSEHYPGINVEVTVTNRYVDLVGEGFDVALRAGKLADSSLVARKLGEATFQLYGSQSYLARAGVPNRVEQLARHECIIFKGKNGSARWSLIGPRRTVEVEVSGRVRGDDLQFCRAMAVAGAGIAFLPTTTVGPLVDSGELIRVLPRYASRPASVHLVYPSTQHLPAKLAVFRDFVVARFPA